MAEPKTATASEVATVVGTGGVDHAALAARSRVWGALHVAQRQWVNEIPFIHIVLLTALGNPIIYLAAMGIGLGALVTSQVAGVPYLIFVAPGLLVSTVATSGAGWGTWPIMGGFKWEKNYVAASATSVTPGQIALGETIGMTARLILQGAAFWVLGLPFNAWHSPWSVLTVPIAMLAGLAFFAPLAAYSATIEDEGIQFNLINRIIVMPMFLFAGTFFPLDVMPIYLQWIGWISPMWHGTQLARVAAFGMAYPLEGVVAHLLVLVAYVAVGLVLMRRNFFRRLTK